MSGIFDNLVRYALQKDQQRFQEEQSRRIAQARERAAIINMESREDIEETRLDREQVKAAGNVARERTRAEGGVIRNMVTQGMTPQALKLQYAEELGEPEPTAPRTVSILNGLKMARAEATAELKDLEDQEVEQQDVLDGFKRKGVFRQILKTQVEQEKKIYQDVLSDEQNVGRKVETTEAALKTLKARREELRGWRGGNYEGEDQAGRGIMRRRAKGAAEITGVSPPTPDQISAFKVVHDLKMDALADRATAVGTDDPEAEMKLQALQQEERQIEAEFEQLITGRMQSLKGRDRYRGKRVIIPSEQKLLDDLIDTTQQMVDIHRQRHQELLSRRGQISSSWKAKIREGNEIHQKAKQDIQDISLLKRGVQAKIDDITNQIVQVELPEKQREQKFLLRKKNLEGIIGETHGVLDTKAKAAVEKEQEKERQKDLRSLASLASRMNLGRYATDMLTGKFNVDDPEQITAFKTAVEEAAIQKQKQYEAMQILDMELKRIVLRRGLIESQDKPLQIEEQAALDNVRAAERALAGAKRQPGTEKKRLQTALEEARKQLTDIRAKRMGVVRKKATPAPTPTPTPGAPKKNPLKRVEK